MDTIKSYARFAFLKPRKIDFDLIQKATHGAAYTIKKLEIDISGVVTKSRCKSCKKDAMFLKVDHTGQLLEIEGNLEIGKHVKIRGSATDWGKDVLGFFTTKKHVILKAIELPQTAK